MAFIQSSNKASSSGSGKSTSAKKKTNSKGESHCFNCGADDHWSSECPHDKMSDEQRSEIADGELKMLMNVEEEMEEEEEGVNMMSVMMFNNGNSSTGVRRNTLSDDRLYLDNCSTVTAV